MSDYYKPKTTYKIFNPNSKNPFEISRSKIDLFLQCPQCFYMDRKMGVKRPPGFPFNLNSAVDSLLKKEFDILRKKKEPHALFEKFNIDAIPYEHEKLDEWRDTFKGVRTVHKETNLEVFGAVDDLWINPEGEIIVVDYKATSKDTEVSIDAPWQIGYKRQMEIYQWILSQMGFKVAKTGYFFYCNGDASKDKFDSKLEFDIKIIPYEGDCSWIENTLKDIKACLLQGKIPEPNSDCDYCKYRKTVSEEKIKFGDKNYTKYNG